MGKTSLDEEEQNGTRNQIHSNWIRKVEVINIDVKSIEYMSLYGIAEQDTISRCDKRIDRSKYCHSLHICIIKKVDKQYPTYGGPSDLTVFERFSKFNDISILLRR